MEKALMPGNRPSLSDRLRCLLLGALPQHAVSRLVLRLTRLRTPAWIPVARWFATRFGVDMEEAENGDIAAYEHFNAFFTRALRPDARPQQGPADTLTSPVDGRVSQMGTVAAGRLLQAKGIDYSLADLLGGDPELATRLDGHAFATLYLAPGDYHRIHMPLAGQLRRMTYVPGRLYSVADWTVRTLPGVFTRNERVCCLFDTDHGPLAMALVGAINVAAIETVWAGMVTPPRGHRVAHWRYDDSDGPRLDRGDEMGRFNMGSTVIVVAPTGYRWSSARQSGARVRVGEALAPAPAATGDQQ